MNIKHFRSLMLCGLAIVALATSTVLRFSFADDAPASSEFCPYVTKDGSISRPTDFREKFTYLGTFADATKDEKSIDELHNVYARPQDVAAYLRDGKFPDGAVLVKEVCGTASENLTTGKAHWATDTKLWFVMIKDAKGRFPGNDLWGDGWGWALFYANEPARNVATDYTTDCKTCHVPAKKDDWVYIRGYPILADHAHADNPHAGSLNVPQKKVQPNH
ncbi:MAG TPA: cytochrome P460 family protein [Lacipirellulaceae bacterium]|jgi:cytochrome c|nr:cytochrome P460 family protein [Lacipirellulaceae bacterium]